MDSGSLDVRQVLADTAPSMMAYWDCELRCHFANRAYGSWFGMDPHALLGCDVRKHLEPTLFALHEPHIRAVLRGESPTCQCAVTSGDGLLRHGLTYYIPHVVDGAVIGLVVQVTDTSALHEARNRLTAERMKVEELERRLLQAQSFEVIGTLASGIAHDFNNVLAAVSGCFHLLDRMVGGGRPRELVARGLRSIERATRLSSQLMGVARTTAGGDATEEVRVTDVAALMRDAQELIAASVGPGISVTVRAPHRCLVMIDGSQLEMAVLNLAINARDAMAGGGDIEVSVSAEPASGSSGRRVIVCVRDNGAGMSASTLARAREPFFSTKKADEGTGLGLVMVNRFAQRSGGSFELQSALGVGTIAKLLLPAAVTDALPLPAEPEGEIDRSRHGEARILVVDDDPSVRLVLENYLIDLDYEVLSADSGQCALDLLEASPPINLVVTDVAMHGIDGLHLADLLRARQPTLPILLVTGGLDRRTPVDQAVLRKPFSQALFARHVLSLLGRAEADGPVQFTATLR